MMLEFILGVYCGAILTIIAALAIALLRTSRQKPEPAPEPEPMSPHAEIVEADTSGALIHLLACEGAVLLRERAS